MMKVTEFVAKAKDIATKYKTLYIMGCFGSPMSATNKKRYTTNHSYNKQSSRKNKINKVSTDTFGFDCVCLIKGILWGWNGATNKTYGGAVYGSNGVPDVGADTMMSKHCKDVSTNFSNIQVGELVWMPGHIGIYIGDGLVVESTPIWKDGVQITALKNLGVKQGYNNRTWTKHGKSIYVDYSVAQPVKPVLLPLDEIAKKVINGDYGVHDARFKKLEAEGYNAREVQNRVNEILKAQKQPTPSKYTPKVGDYVVPIKLVDYKGRKLFQYDAKYQIMEISKNGAVLSAVRGNQRPIWATLALNNIKKVG